jgi:protein phosphatase
VVFSQITHDDTFVQSLIDEGRITEEEANNHPQRSLLLKAITGHEVEPSLTVREARAGDRYLLCSDGLSGVVSAETLAEALKIPDPQACSDRLIELALKGGGPDNVTCIVADVVDIEYGEDAPIIGGAAGDGVEDPQPDSAASRAATTTLPRPKPPKVGASAPAPDPQRRRPRRRRKLLGLGLVIVLLAGGAAAGATWVLGQYFVGVAGNKEVVIFQGVRGDVLGLPLYTQAEGSCRDQTRGCETIYLQDLEQSARVNVTRGMISVNGLEGARQIIGRLRTNELLPLCSETDNKSSTSTGAPTPVDYQPPPSTTPGAPSTTSAAPPAEGQPGGGQLPGQPPPTSTTGTPLPERPSEPGVDCRTVR